VNAPSTPATIPAPARGRRPLWRQLLRSRVAVACLALLGLVVVLCVAAPLLTSANPASSDIAETLAPISGRHPLGGDGVGRDVLARLLYGGRTSLLGTLLATTVALVVGVPAGLVAGYFHGWFDAAASWLSSLLMAVPAIILLLVVLSAVARSTYAAMAVFGILMAPGVFRLIRGSVAGVREHLYVDAARVAGLSDVRIIRRHVLPVVRVPTVIQTAQMLGVGMAIQAGLEFLGLGSASQPSWGAMLDDAFTNIYQRPVLALWPGLALAGTAAAFALLGTALGDTLAAPGPVHRHDGARVETVPGPWEEGEGVPPAAAAPREEGHLLAVRNLRVTYPTAAGSAAVDGVSLSVRRGEVLGLVGESGSGKTQTALAVLGLLPPEARASCDRVDFDGTDLAALGPKRLASWRGARIAYVPQEPMSNLDPSFRVGSQLVEPMRHHFGLSRKEARARALELLSRAGIPDPPRTFRAYPHQISGGMAQRVLIAGAVSCDPDLLIADEPTTALDVTVQAEVLDLLRSLQKEHQMGMILVTHDFGVVADICDTVAIMHRGRVVESAPVTELFARPRHPYTAALLRATLDDCPPRRRGQSLAVDRSQP
jgi:peptide/nickel transport system permease protein